MATNNSMEDAPSKYDSVNESLKMTEPEYRNLRHDGIDVVVESDNHTPVRPSKSEVKHTVRKWANDHELFASDHYDGATYGAIVEFSDVTIRPPNHHSNDKTLLKHMARKALVEDVVEQWMSLTTKYRTDKED